MFNKSSLIIALGIVGCSAYEPDTDEVTETTNLGEAEQPITGGTLVTAAQNTQDPFRAVIGFTTLATERPNCGATKIAQSGGRDKYVTAAHCLTGDFVNTVIRYSVGRNDFAGSYIETRIRAIAQHPSCLIDPAADTLCLHAGEASYDVGVFELDTNTNVAVLSASPAINTTETVANTSLRMIGFGCDDSSTNDGNKQTAIVTSRGQESVPTARFTRYLRTTGTPSGCVGDSGGPLLQNVASPKLVGVTSFALDGTNFTRLANVRRWVATPKTNDLRNEERGFFLNRGQRRCMGKSGTGAIMRDCKGTEQPFDAQYWRLATVSTASGTFFQIQSTVDGACVTTPAANGPVVLSPCSSTNALHHWTLTTSNGFVSVRARTLDTSGSARCLTAGTSFTVGAGPCTAGEQRLDWVFHP